MGIIELLLLAIGLSMDAFAVAVCKGLATPQLKPRHLLIAGAWFGGFQALMPLIGYFLGAACESYIRSLDHWVAFVLLFLIGANMVKEALFGIGIGTIRFGGQGKAAVIHATVNTVINIER